jgi:Family of unknown function (DUF5681)
MTIGKPFKKGQSGNPGGRPKVVAEVKELARKHTGKAIETLVSIMANPKAAPAARVSAANALLDRGYGRPAQHITGDIAASYVARLPEPAKTAHEWLKSLETEEKPLLQAETIQTAYKKDTPTVVFPKPPDRGRVAARRCLTSQPRDYGPSSQLRCPAWPRPVWT